MRRIILLLILALPFCAIAQEEVYSRESGILTLGMRSTVSVFNNENPGTGVGGQFRLKFARKINSEWFADYITTNISDLARRTDSHIGWSVMFYPLNSFVEQGRKIPYILAGHCFDYTQITTNGVNPLSESRWSSAVQMGLGGHWYFTDKFDISLSGQYMMHLGKDIEATEYIGAFGEKGISIVKEDEGLEGHLLITLSVNTTIADLWGK